jgi:hypothetical protein
MKAKEYIKPGYLMEIRYEEFKNHPTEILREIYRQFNIPGIEAVLPLMESYIGNNHPDTRIPYQIAPETYRLVNEFAGDIVRNLGYQTVESPQ